MKVIQIIPNLALAGAETMCATLSEELYKEKIEVTVVSLYSYHSSLTDRLEKRGIRVLYLGKKRGADPKIIVKLYKIFREIKPEVVHTHLYVLPYVVPAAILAGVNKRIHTVHNVASKEAQKRVRLINNVYYHLNVVIPIALSGEIRNTICETYHIPQKNIPVIYNGVDLSRCIKKDSYLRKGVLRFIHIGRFTEQKNHEMMIDAFSKVHNQLPESELILIGDGELRSRIENKIQRMGLVGSIHLVGQTDNVYSCLNNADAFLLPSLYEGMPMSIIEAMGTGLPIIASNVGGIPSMITNGSEGLLVDVNVKSIADAMLQMNDDHLREQFGTAAAQKANEIFSAKNMAERYIKIYGGA